MSFKPNRAYNNPEIGAAMNSIASMFAPPDSGELVNYAQARGLNQTNDIIEKLRSDPRYAGADAGVLANLYDPTQSWQALDMGDATARRAQDVTAQTSTTNNQADNQRALVQTRFGPVAEDAMLPDMPSSVAGMYALPALPGVQGLRSPLSAEEARGARILDGPALTSEELIALTMGPTPTQNVMDPATNKPVVSYTPGAVGQEPAPSSPLVNIGAGENAFDVETGKLFAQRYDTITNQAGVAQEMLGLLGAAEGALGSGVYTGIGGDQLLDLQRLGTALGVDNAEQVAGGELVRAIQNRMALLMRNPESGMGMPGAVSDRDLQFLKAAQPGLGRTPEGNRQLLGMLAAMERRKIEIANLADTYVQENGRLDVGFNQMVREYAKANPLFPDPASAGNANDAGGEVYAVNPATGERVVYRGGQWQAAE